MKLFTFKFNLQDVHLRARKDSDKIFNCTALIVHLNLYL